MTIEEYVKIDKTFNRSLFIGEINKMLQDIFIAISSNNLDMIKNYMKEEIFLEIKKFMERNNKDGLSLKYNKVFIDSSIKNIDIENGEPIIKVSSVCSYAKYYVSNENTVIGNEKEIIQTIHNISFIKNKENLSFYRCTGCGASYDVIKDTRCPHCGTNLNENLFNYYIVEME